MFRNRWGALLFVGMTLAGVTKLVGTEKHEGAILDATHQIADQKAQADAFVQEQTVVSEEVDDIPLASDDMLIDSTIGEDPTPVDEFAAANPSEAATEDTVVIVSRETSASLQAQQQVPVVAQPLQ